MRGYSYESTLNPYCSNVFAIAVLTSVHRRLLEFVLTFCFTLSIFSFRIVPPFRYLHGLFTLAIQ